MYFGKANGEYLEVAQASYLSPVRLTYRIVRPSQIGQLQRYQLLPTGQIGALLGQNNDDPRVRPWYQVGRRANVASWSPIYQFEEDANVLGISLVKNYYDGQNQFQGVLGVDFTLFNLNQILQNFHPAPGIVIFMMEPDGQLIANSIGELPHNQSLQRIHTTQAQSPLLRAAAQQFLSTAQVTTNTPLEYSFQLRLEQQQHYGRVLKLQNSKGLNW